MSAFFVRPFEGRDRGDVRRIAVSTAMMGAPSGAFFSDDEVMADALTCYFTDHEPYSCFVAEVEGRVEGYIIGTKDVRNMGRVFQRKIFWPLLGKALRRGVLLSLKNWQTLGQVVLAGLQGRMTVPDLTREYPAALHINVLAASRARGVGGALMAAFLEMLKKSSVPGVAMATMSEEAGVFFAKHGFVLLFRSSRPYFHHLIGRDVPLLIYGKEL